MQVPITARLRWQEYWLEGILCCVLAAYAFNYAIGRNKNQAIALNFLKLNKPLLDDNFTLVGERFDLLVCHVHYSRGLFDKVTTKLHANNMFTL